MYPKICAQKTSCLVHPQNFQKKKKKKNKLWHNPLRYNLFKEKWQCQRLIKDVVSGIPENSRDVESGIVCPECFPLTYKLTLDTFYS